MASKVRIQRFVAELDIPSEDLFDSISQKAANFINRNIPNLIDQVIRDLVDPNVDYIIDSIEVDLGKINFENIPDLNQSFQKKFKYIVSIKLANAQVDKSFKFERGILDFIEYGKFPWWMDQTAPWKRQLPEKLSKTFLDKISSLLLVSKEHFFRLKNLLGQDDLDQLLKHLLKKEHLLYSFSLQLLEKLVQKTKHKWVSPDFDKKTLQYFLVSEFSKKRIDKKEILYQFLNRFASQTRQEFSSILSLSVSEKKESNSALDQILKSISQENQINQRPQNLNPLDAISILITYFEKGYEEIPSGYSDFSLLKGLLRKVLNKNKDDFMFALKSLNLKGSPIKIQRFLFLLDESESYLSAFFSSDQHFQWMSEVITLIESSQVINLLERQSTLFENKNLNHALLRLVVEQNITDLNHQVLMEKLLQIIASDYNMNYSDLVKELFLSFKSGSQQSKSFSVLENLYVREVSQKLIFKPQAEAFVEMKDAELANQLSFFQRQSLEYFKKLFSHSSFEALYQNTFHTSNELLTHLLQAIQKIQGEDFTNLSLTLLREMSTLTKTPFSTWVEGVVKFIHHKTYLNTFDYQILAKFIREQYEDDNEIKTIFRYDHQKKLNPQQEEIITFLLKLFPHFEIKKGFKIKFSDVEVFEVFLVNFFQSVSETNLSLLFENAFSQITIHTQIPFTNIIALVLEGLKGQRHKTPLDHLVMINYKTVSVDNLEEDQQLIERAQLYLDQKSIPFLHYKRILFLFDHLEELLNKNSSYKSAFKKPENLFDFLAQGFPSTSSSYAINLKLLDRIAKKIKLPFDQLITTVLNSIKTKVVKTSLDFEFLASFDTTDPSQDKLLFTISEEQNLDHLRKSVFRFYFMTFLNFKNYKSAFKDDLDLAQFVFDQLKLNQNESFELKVPLLFSAFGKRIQTSVSNLYLVTVERIISRKKTDELSRRLLSKMILSLLEIHSPKFNFGSTASSIKTPDDLILNLSKHKKIYPDLLQQLVYFPNFLSTLKLDSYKKAIRQLIEGSNIRFEWIENLLKENLQSTKGNLNARIRFLILKILFDTKLISSEMEFQKILRQYLIRHDPDVIKEGIFNSEFKSVGMEKDQSEKSAIKKIIDLLSKQKDQFISPFKENSFEKNQFDYLLQYKNDILITKNQDDSKRIENELDDFESIFSDSDSLLFFLITYANDLEILLAFTELVLSKENEKIVQLRLDQLNKKFLRVEQRIIDLHNEIRFSNLKEKTFKILLRTFLFKNIGANKRVSNFSISDFIYGFLEHLSRERYLSLRAINDITFFKETDSISQEINLALSVFTDRGIYYGISKRVRDEVYFKDLSIAVIKHQQLPDWALSKTFTVEDAWAFVISKIEDQDYEFTSKLIKELSVTEGFLKSIEEKSTPFFINLFRQIQNPQTDYDLSIKFQELVSYFSKHPWNTKDQTDIVLSSYFLRDGLWKGIGLIQLSEKISDFLKDRSEREPDQLKQEIRQALKLSDAFISFQKLSQLGTEEKIELIKYFFEMGQLPKEVNFDQVKIKKHFKDLLLENTQAIKKLWKNYIGQPEAVSNILKILSETQLIQSIKSAFFLESKDHELFGASLFMALKDLGADKKRLSNLMRITRQYIIGKALKENTLIPFSSTLQKEDKPIYNAFIKKLIEMQSSNDWDTSSELGQFLNKIQQKEALEGVIENQEKIDLERLEYYVEFGSTQFDDILLGIDDLYKLFKKLLRRDRLLIKKRLHQWGNSKNKIRKIIKLHPQEDQVLLLDHIHIELSSYLTALDQLMVDEFNTTLPMALGLENWEGLIAYNFGYWSSKNLIMYSLKDLIQLFVNQLLKQLRVSKEDLTHILVEGLTNTSKTIKNQLNEWISQLESPSRENKKPDQISDFDDLDKTGSLFIENAGLILLWPFLSRLFDKLNLLEDKNFVDETAQQKAILLTEYLVTGNTDFQESSLALNKLICGAPLETYVDVNLSIEAFELKLCDSLLKSMIDNWEKINNSSISTLRETFLIREGVLVRSNANFKLNVEKKPFDVLLTTLPWTISMIQTSFMKNRIIVTWI
tara:strand:+ start:89469 stop:95588 length:6120 start_codon:yes stop_codon:yes gene_type:complete